MWWCRRRFWIPIHLAYFYQPGCPECDRVQLALNYLQDQYPQLNVCTLDVREQATLCEWLGEQADVLVGKRLTAPAVFVEDEALVGDDLHPGSLEALLARYAESGARPICTGDVSDEVASTIVERFRSFGLATVLVAGLVDGLNPCAFATLVFLGGIVTSIGPCNVAMIPLIIGYLGGSADAAHPLSRQRAFTLSLTFATGLAITFTALGVIASLAGGLIGGASRVWYYVVAAVCILIALHMWGAIRLPEIPGLVRLRERATLRGIPGALALGLVSGLLASQCATPVLVAILTYVMARQEVLIYGAALLFVYALGRGAPVVLAGTFTGALTRLRALGRWSGVMEKVSAAIVLGVGLYFLWIA